MLDVSNQDNFYKRVTVNIVDESGAVNFDDHDPATPTMTPKGEGLATYTGGMLQHRYGETPTPVKLDTSAIRKSIVLGPIDENRNLETTNQS